MDKDPWVQSPAMDGTVDTAEVIIRPPLGWALAVIVGLALDWLLPLPFLPAGLPAALLGAMVFVIALAVGARTGGRGARIGVRTGAIAAGRAPRRLAHPRLIGSASSTCCAYNARRRARDGRYPVAKLAEAIGMDRKLSDWLYGLTKDCPCQAKHRPVRSVRRVICRCCFNRTT